ncbi:conserved protein of unknown function [Candidatus Filomicrobium marinum]|uniref:Zinc-finger protein n=2 Tax=Filomicrobium TaxID=119044 RepID=A0A0D6JK18_9HYPH|nr:MULTISPECIES: DUF983 domain-containing protein [Filomicrobium]CFX58107.1 conserved protein of unknown function [Candidatus Filomicrobium marinum]CPR22313.1 conserved protein of unknown function [Candidatus Filomicrobium marinum]SDO88788.1 Uncharacterized conserved protein, DUF983 family [Filomicrobium insigne]
MPTETGPDTKLALARGSKCRCPNCGEGKLFASFLKVNDHCPNCGEALYHHRADDLPAYLVMVIVGHIVIALVMFADSEYNLSFAWHLAIWVPLTLVLSLAMLQPVKGFVVALQWKSGMHGFGEAQARRLRG